MNLAHYPHRLQKRHYSHRLQRHPTDRLLDTRVRKLFFPLEGVERRKGGQITKFSKEETYSGHTWYMYIG